MNKAIFVVFFLFCVKAFAQPLVDQTKVKSLFPGEQVVTIKNSESVNVEIVKGKLSIISDNYLERIYLDSRAGAYSEGSVDYPHFGEILKIEAGTLIPKNNGYKTVKVKDFKISEKLSNSVFYDASKSVTFFYPSLQEGAKTYLKYQESLTEPTLLTSFYFQWHISALEAEYSISVPEGLELGYKIFNDDTLIKFSKRKVGKKDVYAWKANNIKQYEPEPGAPGIRHILPHILIWIKSYKVDDKVIPLLNNPDGLYKWYNDLLKNNMKSEKSPVLKSIVDSLVKGTTTEIEKVKKIYYWVQDNIKYIAFEDGMGGFVPRSATLVCEKRYGDCKDMANIIHTMLSFAGISSHRTWIGSRDIPYRYEETPVPSVDNHMITTYIAGDKYYFLDATGQHTSYDMPTSFIQGKEAMIEFDNTKYQIKEVPVMAKEKSKIIDSVDIVMIGNKVMGHGKTTFTGYYDTEMSYLLTHSSDRQKKVLRDYYEKGSNKFLLDSVNVGPLYNRDVPLTINYTFNIEDYIRSNEDEVYVNLGLGKDLGLAVLKKDRKQEVEFDFKSMSESIVNFTVPEGYKVDFIPKNLSIKNEQFGFDFQYKQTGNKITLSHKIYIDTLLLKKADFVAWNAMVKKILNSNSEVVILKKIKK